MDFLSVQMFHQEYYVGSGDTPYINAAKGAT